MWSDEPSRAQENYLRGLISKTEEESAKLRSVLERVKFDYDEIRDLRRSTLVLIDEALSRAA